MTLFFTAPQPGDWIKTTKTIKVTMSDYLAGDSGGIKPGTMGVITRNSGWSSLEVRLNTGFGGVTVRVKPHQVRIVRRSGGVDAFHSRMARVNAARIGVAMAFIAPLTFFVISWFIQGGTKDGLVAAIIYSAIYGIFDLIIYALSNPVNAIIYIGIVTAAGRFAFRA